MLDAAEVAVEFLAPERLAHLIKQLTEVLAGSQGAVPAGMDVGHVEDRNGPLDMIADLQNFVERPPQFLPTTSLDANQRGLLLYDPWKCSIVFGFLLVTPKHLAPLDDASEYVSDVRVGLGTRTEFSVRPDMIGDVPSIDHLRRLH